MLGGLWPFANLYDDRSDAGDLGCPTGDSLVSCLFSGAKRSVFDHVALQTATRRASARVRSVARYPAAPTRTDRCRGLAQAPGWHRGGDGAKIARCSEGFASRCERVVGLSSDNAIRGPIWKIA